jgi:ribosome-associated protein
MPALEVNDAIAIPLDEFQFETSRSGGPGGQNVNKVNSKVQLRWTPSTSPSLPDAVKARLLLNVANRLTREGELLIASTRTRDQGQNVEDCLDKLRNMILVALNPPKPRRATRPTLASKKRRVEAKQRRSDVKRGRQTPDQD